MPDTHPLAAHLGDIAEMMRVYGLFGGLSTQPDGRMHITATLRHDSPPHTYRSVSVHDRHASHGDSQHEDAQTVVRYLLATLGWRESPCSPIPEPAPRQLKPLKSVVVHVTPTTRPHQSAHRHMATLHGLMAALQSMGYNQGQETDPSFLITLETALLFD